MITTWRTSVIASCSFANSKSAKAMELVNLVADCVTRSAVVRRDDLDFKDFIEATGWSHFCCLRRLMWQ